MRWDNQRAMRPGQVLTGHCLCLPSVVFTDSGISLENGVYAAAVVPGSPAAKEGSLAVGDRIVAVSLRPGAVCPMWTVRGRRGGGTQSSDWSFYVCLVL